MGRRSSLHHRALIVGVFTVAVLAETVPGIAASDPMAHGAVPAPSRMTLGEAPRELQEAVGATLGHARASARHPIQQAEFKASDPGTYLGDAVALSGTTAVVGADGEDSYTGAAYVFVTDGRPGPSRPG